MFYSLQSSSSPLGHCASPSQTHSRGIQSAVVMHQNWAPERNLYQTSFLPIKLSGWLIFLFLRLLRIKLSQMIWSYLYTFCWCSSSHRPHSDSQYSHHTPCHALHTLLYQSISLSLQGTRGRYSSRGKEFTKEFGLVLNSDTRVEVPQPTLAVWFKRQILWSYQLQWILTIFMILEKLTLSSSPPGQSFSPSQK